MTGPSIRYPAFQQHNLKPAMKIVFIHYHLKTGGVTTVIKQQIEALGDDCQVLVLTGSPPADEFPAKFVVVPELAYTHPDQSEFNPRDVAEAISDAIQDTFQGECDIVHVHNPTLAKNKHFLSILKQLQLKKIKLFLQIHDFAEDGRPLSYYYHEAYPTDCHYGALNTRDYNILLRAGLKQTGVHHIPNMVSPVVKKHIRQQNDNFVLYPIRAIRRKNIGEAILLSLFFEDNQELIITLPPNSPIDILSYRDWIAFTQKHQLSVEFDAGVKKDFQALVQTARFLITTSITEGFGFSFLEPWMHDKLLWGRKLNAITQDFEQKGIQLDHLYLQLMVPVDWIGLTRLSDRWQTCVQNVCDVFDYPIQKDHITASFEQITADGVIDFGLLDETFQKRIIGRVLDDTKSAQLLQQMNSFLARPVEASSKARLIQDNKRAILANYDPRSYRRRLMRIYQSVSQTPIKQRIDKFVLLTEFLKLNEFSLLKWCDYIE